MIFTWVSCVKTKHSIEPEPDSKGNPSSTGWDRISETVELFTVWLQYTDAEEHTLYLIRGKYEQIVSREESWDKAQMWLQQQCLGSHL